MHCAARLLHFRRGSMKRHAYVMAALFAAPLAAEGEPGMWSDFNWGIHSITIPAVFLLGLIAGWLLRERKAAEERAREEIARSKESPDSRKSGGPEVKK